MSSPAKPLIAEHESAPSDRGVAQFLHIDVPLMFVLVLILCAGLVVLYSASGQDIGLLTRQGIRIGLGFVALLILAQTPMDVLKLWTPWIYIMGLTLLVWVIVAGDIGKGAQRWLDLGFIRFQPSEMMKLAVPMMIAWLFSERSLPPSLADLVIAVIIVLLPAVLIILQPDLGTALLVMSAGVFAIFLAGIRWQIMAILMLLAVAAAPVMWIYFMHDYQRQRILTLLNPEIDPLGSGYHIIQSMIAIGSGGTYGKGWLNGTQSQLDFIPERSTDFIFAVFGEEFGLMGVALLLIGYIFIVLRGLYIAARAQDTYARLFAGALSMTFFVYIFVNMGMVSGMLPVVGVPLPLISYGGTSIVTLLASFGILMSTQYHRKLLVY